MRFHIPFRHKRAPEPRLMPLDAYPASLDEAARDRVDKILREQMHTLPAEPDDYLDNEGERWVLDANGAWTDHHGHRRSSLYSPVVSTFGPFTRVSESVEVTNHG